MSGGIAQLQRQVGGDIEDITYIVLHDVLRREFGWQVCVSERTWQTWNNEIEKIDVFGSATDPARPEQTIWIVGEAKHNLTAREVERFTRQVERAQQHLEGEIFAVCFCYRARPEVQQQVKTAGLRLVFSYGKLVWQSIDALLTTMAYCQEYVGFAVGSKMNLPFLHLRCVPSTVEI